MKRLFPVLIICLFADVANAQEIPLFGWRTHFSYSSVVSITETPNRIFAAADVGLFAVDKDGSGIQRYSTFDGFQAVDASVVHFDRASGVLLIGYRTGNLDIVVDGEVINLDLVSDSQVIGSMKINDIATQENVAYIATDYGILKFSLLTLEVRETYREIGENASQLGVNRVVINSGKIFAATPRGIQTAALSGGNLSDFRAWQRYSALSVIDMATANGKVYALENSRLIEYVADAWLEIIPETASAVTGLGTSSDGLLLYSAGQIEVMAANLSVTDVIGGEGVGDVQDALIDEQGTAWLGDATTGLWRIASSGATIASPTGPVRSVPFNLTYSGGELFALPGGYSSTVIPWGDNYGYTTFSGGIWENTDLQAFRDVVAARKFQGDTYLASAGDGLLVIRDGEQTKYDQANSPLEANAEGVIIPAISGEERLYVLNYESSTPLLRLSADGTWETFSSLPSYAARALGMETFQEFAWLILPVSTGGLLAFDSRNGQFRRLTEQSDNGGLSSSRVNDAVLDDLGYLWIATDRGVSVWFSPFELGGPINAAEPVFEGRPLLVDNEVYCISVDGGNRKWIGTDRGAWLFDEFADELIFHFTRDNSPLPSDEVRDIAIDGNTGEVFFLTDEGMVSFRSDATAPAREHTGVKIFPNPVESRFQGEVAITGLVAGADVRVTDSSGRLVYQTRSNGGTATWPVRQNPGGSPAAGMYYVFSVSSDGVQTYVGKVAVTD